jgi:ADP-heptose:LPS heptosyltransferase
MLTANPPMTTPQHSPGLPTGAGAVLHDMCRPAHDAFVAAHSTRAALRAKVRAAIQRADPGRPPSDHVRYEFARILVIVPGHLGDVIAATPAITRLRAAYPDAWIASLAGPWGRDVLDRLDDVSAIIECRFPAFDRARRAATGAGIPGRLTRTLTRAITAEVLRRRTAATLRGKFDAAVILATDFAWGASVAAQAAIPIRVGPNRPAVAPYLTHPIGNGDAAPVGEFGRATPRRHVVAQMIDVAETAIRALESAAPRPAGAAENSVRYRNDPTAGKFVAEIPPPGPTDALRYDPRADERDIAARIWNDAGLPDSGDPAVIVVHPVPGAAVKRWAPDRWADVIDAIHTTYPARVVLTGTTGDAAETGAIAAACKVGPGPINVAGRMTFGALSAFLDRVRVVIGPDGGTLHLAGARGVPTVRLFGPTDAATWGAWTGATGAAVAPPDAVAISDVRSVPAVHVSSPRRCAPCHRLELPTLPGGAIYPCMDAIEVTTVMRAIAAAWEATTPSS